MIELPEQIREAPYVICREYVKTYNRLAMEGDPQAEQKALEHVTELFGGSVLSGVISKSLNECGQNKDGKFVPGNTCASGHGEMVAWKEVPKELGGGIRWEFENESTGQKLSIRYSRVYKNDGRIRDSKKTKQLIVIDLKEKDARSFKEDKFFSVIGESHEKEEELMAKARKYVKRKFGIDL